jgi:hypothetical protein
MKIRLAENITFNRMPLVVWIGNRSHLPSIRNKVRLLFDNLEESEEGNCL